MAIEDKRVVYTLDEQVKIVIPSPKCSLTIEQLQSKKAIQKGLISESEKTILYNCATGLKYPMPEVSQLVNKNEKIDFSEF